MPPNIPPTTAAVLDFPDAAAPLAPAVLAVEFAASALPVGVPPKEVTVTVRGAWVSLKELVLRILDVELVVEVVVVSMAVVVLVAMLAVVDVVVEVLDVVEVVLAVVVVLA